MIIVRAEYGLITHKYTVLLLFLLSSHLLISGNKIGKQQVVNNKMRVYQVLLGFIAFGLLLVATYHGYGSFHTPLDPSKWTWDHIDCHKKPHARYFAPHEDVTPILRSKFPDEDPLIVDLIWCSEYDWKRAVDGEGYDNIALLVRLYHPAQLVPDKSLVLRVVRYWKYEWKRWQWRILLLAEEKGVGPGLPDPGLIWTEEKQARVYTDSRGEQDHDQIDYAR